MRADEFTMALSWIPFGTETGEAKKPRIFAMASCGFLTNMHGLSPKRPGSETTTAEASVRSRNSRYFGFAKKVIVPGFPS